MLNYLDTHGEITYLKSEVIQWQNFENIENIENIGYISKIS